MAVEARAKRRNRTESSPYMGLKGQLEDLPLLDMLQIIAFSKKSGYLRISGSKGRGAVMLKEGRILFSYSWSTIPALQQLVRAPETITPALIRGHVEASLRELGGLREGRFEFELADPTSEEFGGVKIQPFLLPQGLDAQEILLDLAVEIDNERRETTSLLEMAFQGDFPPGDSPIETESLFGGDVGDPAESELVSLPSSAEAQAEAEAEAVARPEPAAEAPAKPRPTVVLVDDEAPVRDIVSEELTMKGYRVFTASNPAAGANAVRERLESGEAVMVVVDLKMPTSSERSFFGGFELVRRVQRNQATVPILLMAESLSEKAKARAKELGIRRLVFKPTLSKIDAELYIDDLRKFAETIHEQLQRLPQDRPLASAGDGRGESSAHPVDTSRMDFLASMTRKLIDPGGSTDVSRLVMMVAQRFVERGILFVVKGDTARGLAAFGVGNAGRRASNAQNVVIEIPHNPAFTEVVRRASAYRVTDELRSLEPTLFSELGRGRTSEAVLIPLLYNRATLLVLYGDNTNSGRPLGDLNDLELFIAQAGMALENKLLQRKLSVVDAHWIEDVSHDARA